MMAVDRCVVAGDSSLCAALKQSLGPSGPDLEAARDGESAIRLLSKQGFTGLIVEDRLADMRATDEHLLPLTEATNGSVFWLAEDGLPTVRKTGLDRAQSGRDWIGFHRNDQYLVTGANQMPLLPAILALLLLLTTLGAAWYREGR